MAQYAYKSSIFWNFVRLSMLLKHLKRFHRVTQGKWMRLFEGDIENTI